MPSGQSNDDHCLLRAYRDDADESAFTELVERHLDLVFGLAYRLLQDRQFAEDASQRVFTALACKVQSQPIRHVSSWLFATTQREVQFMMRTEARRRRREKKAFELELATSVTPEGSAMEGMGRVLHDALGRLSENDQQALFLRFYEEQEFGDLAKTLGIQERAAQKRVYRAMDRLRHVLKKRGITATTAIFSSQLFTAGAAPAPAGLATSVSHGAVVAAGSGLAWGWIKTLPVPVSIAATAVLVFVTTALVIKPQTGWLFGSSWDSKARPLVAEQVPANQYGSRLAIDDIEGIYRLNETEREAALVRLIRYLESPKGEEEEFYLTDLFMRWTRLEPPRNATAIVELASRLPDEPSGEREDMLTSLMELPLDSWWLRDPLGVESWVAQLSRTSRGERVAFKAALRVIAKEDPPRAFALLASRVGTGDDAYRIVAERFMAQGTDQVETWLATLPETSDLIIASESEPTMHFQDTELPILRLYSALLPMFFERDRQATADWVVDLPEDLGLEIITAQFVKLWADFDPAAAAGWVNVLPEISQRASLPMLIDTWVRKDPTAALDWLRNHCYRAEDAYLFGRASDVLQPTVAWSYLKTMEAGPGKEQFLAHTIFALSQNESRASMERRLSEIQVTETRWRAARSLAQGMIIGQGRSALSHWRQRIKTSDPELAQSFLEGETEITAALNPRAAAVAVLSMPTGEERDRLLEILVRRTYRRGESGVTLATLWLEEFHSLERQEVWRSRLQKTAESAHALPPRLSNSFSKQTFTEFQERLDLLSNYPLTNN